MAGDGFDTDWPSKTNKAPSSCLGDTQNNWHIISELYLTTCDELALYLRKAYGDGPPDPDDVAQQAFERLSRYQDINSVRNLRAFLWRTARNLLLTYRRDAETRSKYNYEIEQLYFPSSGSEANPERVLEVNQQLHIVERTLAAMPQRRRDAFLLHRVEGLTLTATGKRLGVTRHAIIKHVTRAAVDIETALAEDSAGDA
ncbi:MAG: sigma-70 family RNA polymerase sigma factor [Pseudomonadota bacterium]